jgi:hypothetical protein
MRGGGGGGRRREGRKDSGQVHCHCRADHLAVSLVLYLTLASLCDRCMCFMHSHMCTGAHTQSHVALACTYALYALTQEVALKTTPIVVLQCIASLLTCCIAGRLCEVPEGARAAHWHGARIGRGRSLHEGWHMMVW